MMESRKNPDEMTTSQRLDEIAQIITIVFARILKPQDSDKCEDLVLRDSIHR
jgi:hypothetical protein